MWRPVETLKGVITEIEPIMLAAAGDIVFGITVFAHAATAPIHPHLRQAVLADFWTADPQFIANQKPRRDMG